MQGTYQGGQIKMGSLIALCNAEGELDMRYQQINLNGEIRTGSCVSKPEILPDGRLRLHETWQWSTGERGSSTIEEIPG